MKQEKCGKKKATTAVTVVAHIINELNEKHQMIKQSITASLTPTQAIVNEANRMIAMLNTDSTNSGQVEAALESLKVVAEVVAPSLAIPLAVRLISIRNNLHVNSIMVA